MLMREDYDRIFNEGFDEGSEWAYNWVLSYLEDHQGLQETIAEIERMWRVVDKDRRIGGCNGLA